MLHVYVICGKLIVQYGNPEIYRWDITISLFQRRLELSHPNVHHKGLVHPRRIMQVHDFLYITEGEWEIFLGEKPYLLEKDDMIILHAGVEHYGNKPCLPETKVYFLHVFPEEPGFVQGDIRNTAARMRKNCQRCSLPR